MKNNLVIVDIQNGFTKKEETNKVVFKIKQLLEADVFDAVIATRFINHPGGHYEEFIKWNEMETPEEQAVRDEILSYVDRVIDKDTYSCVTKEFLDAFRELNDGELPRLIYIAGVDTDCCVQAAAISLFDRKIRPVVLADYCYSNGGQKFHEAGLLTLSRNIGADAVIKGKITSREQLKENET